MPSKYNNKRQSNSTTTSPLPLNSISSTIYAGPSTATGTTNSQSGKTSKPSFSAGSIAGAAVGCFFAGILLAAFLVWFVMDKRLKKKRHSHSGGFRRRRSEGTYTPGTEKPLPLVSTTSDGPVGQWEKHLPQAESDGNIGENVKGMLEHIAVHVENFYRDSMVNITEEMHNGLMDPNVDSPYLPDSVAALLPQTSRPTSLIKHCVTRSVIAHILPEGNIADSFLPDDFVALPHRIAQKEKTASNTTTKTAFHPALSRWRQLSAYLRPEWSADEAYLTARDRNIAHMADTLCRVFDPWSMQADSFPARRTNLMNIMKSAAETGILLFAQPSTFSYRWRIPAEREKMSGGGTLRIVLLPGLLKVRDADASERERPLELVRAVTGTIVG